MLEDWEEESDIIVFHCFDCNKMYSYLSSSEYYCHICGSTLCKNCAKIIEGVALCKDC